MTILHVPTSGQLPMLRPGLASRIQAKFVELRLSAAARQYAEQAFLSPSRAVQSTPRSMAGRYPSSKTGLTIGFESKTMELAAILRLEADDETIAYVDQPPSLQLTYKVNGRGRGHRHTPDFLRVSERGVTLIEVKTETALESRPALFTKTAGRWKCPPALAAAAELGLGHEVWSEPDFRSSYIRNLRMLEEYLTRSCGDLPGETAALGAIRALLEERPRIALASAVQMLSGTANIDHLLKAIARGSVAADLDNFAIVDRDLFMIYRDRSTLEAYKASDLAIARAGESRDVGTVTIDAGRRLDWSGVIWKVSNVGIDTITLTTGDRVEALPKKTVLDLARDGVIKEADAVLQRAAFVRSESDEILSRARPEDLERALLRHKRIQPYLANTPKPCESRTLRRYIASYRAAEAAHGNGFVGLLPGYAACGNRLPRLPQRAIDIALELIRTHYLNAVNARRKTVYGKVAARCETEGLMAPSYGWFCKTIRSLDAYKISRSRGGSRFAYSLEPRTSRTPGVDAQMPDRPYELAHIDHTECDLETVYADTSYNLGRAWITLMIDQNTRSVLGLHLTYDPPSYRSVLMCIRDCVRRHGRLPTRIVVDGGKEFRSIWFEVMCALKHVTIVWRPKTSPRFGAVCERLFGTTNSELLHNMEGNTQLLKNVRQMTPEVDPKKLAIWSFPELRSLLENFYFSEYDQTPHRELLVSPSEALKRGLAMFGTRPLRAIAYDQSFIIETSPTTKRGTAKVTREGVKIHYLWYYAPSLTRALKRSVPVRYDPMDLSTAWAYVDGSWVTVRSRFADALRNRSERQIEDFTEEWRKRRSDVERIRLSDTALVKFMLQVEKEEQFLKDRRRAAEERRANEPQGQVEPCDQAAMAENVTSSPTEAKPEKPDMFDLEGITFKPSEVY